MNATQRQHGQALFLVGGRGVGKSRLADEAAARGQSLGMRVLWGRASMVGPPVALRPLAEALLGLFRSGEIPADPGLEPYRRILGHLVPDWRHGEPAHEAESPVVLAEAVLRLVSAVGQGCGSLVILEDLHHADSRTLAAVEYLVDNLARQPVMLLATARNGSGEAMELARTFDRCGAAALVRVDDLDRGDVRRLVAGYLRTDPDRVTDRLAAWLWDVAAGNPFLTERAAGALRQSHLLDAVDGGWHLADEPDDTLAESAADSVADSVADDARRLGPEGTAFLTAAAVFGRRFPPAAVRAMTGMSEPETARYLRAALLSRMLVHDEGSPAWYAFRYPLTVRALLCHLTHAERASLARGAAETMERLQPGPPWEWARLAAALRRDGGDPPGAARLLVEAARRAIEAGVPGMAVETLELARDTLRTASEPGLGVLVAARLAAALVEVGQVDRARRLGDTIDELDPAAHDARELVELRLWLARAAILTDRPAESRHHLAAARALIGPDAPESVTAPLDAATAHLVARDPDPRRRGTAAELARGALEMAERHGLTSVACQASELLGLVAYDRNLAESTGHFTRLSAIAHEHRMPAWRLRARLRLGHNEWLATGDDGRVRRARDDAERAGATGVVGELDAHLALYRVLGGEFAAAAELIDRSRDGVDRSGVADAALLLLLADAVHAAHRCDRRAMERARVEFEGRNGATSPLGSLMPGLAGVFCALLQEDRALAQREMAAATAGSGLHPLAGQDGLRILLKVLSEQDAGPGYDTVAARPAGPLRWNQQFILFARAVEFGRAGWEPEAMTAMRQADQASAVFPVARHLGLRLVAEAAQADGWGEPAAWLHHAEEFFHAAAVPTVEGACRSLLRRAGVSVRQRRVGVDRIPPRLFRLGVTVREYEVLELLAHRLGNQAIATRLFISPRTVEKHVASLMAKTRQPNRVALTVYALTAFRHEGRSASWA